MDVCGVTIPVNQWWNSMNGLLDPYLADYTQTHTHTHTHTHTLVFVSSHKDEEGEVRLMHTLHACVCACMLACVIALIFS